MIKADLWHKIEDFRVKQFDNVNFTKNVIVYRYNSKKNKKQLRIKS